MQAKKVAVVGGGNVAMDAARCAKRLGAEVYIIYRRGIEELPARAEEVEHAQEEGVIFKTLTNPTEILGYYNENDKRDPKNNTVCGIKCVKMVLGDPDESGRRRPSIKPDSHHIIDVDCVIMALGTSPNPLIKSTTEGLDTHSWGGIIADENGQTSREGVFAGGMDKDIVYQGAVTTMLVMAAYFIGEFMETGQWHIVASNDGITMAFLTMSMCEIFHSFNMRSRRQSIFTLSRQNKWLWGSGIAALLLTTVVIEVPALARLFEFATISWKEYGLAMGLAFLIIPVVEIVKAIQRSVAKSRGEELRS
jgi:hypothetical protein